MPRPSKEWERRYGKLQQKEHRLSGAEDILSATEKLAGGVQEACVILLQALRLSRDPSSVMRLLDMDDMQMFGPRIVRAYHEWAGNDYDKLMKGVESRDESLIRFIAGVPINRVTDG